MGTSNAYGGPGSGTPLVPSWLNNDAEPSAAPNDRDGDNDAQLGAVPPAPLFPPLPTAAPDGWFTIPRNNFSRFARSGGGDRASLGRAVSHYVRTPTGGSRTAAERMGASRAAGAQLLGFLSGVVTNGPRDTLRALKLEHLAGQPVEQIFLGLIEYVCPEGGTVDEGIAREAFIEAIAELAENGIVDLEGLTADQMQTIFELYAAHAIEARLCNDIGTKAITLPGDLSQIAEIQKQLLDFVRRGVSDALTVARAAMQALSPDRVLGFVNRIYEQAFGILQTLGEAEAERG